MRATGFSAGLPARQSALRSASSVYNDRTANDQHDRSEPRIARIKRIRKT